MADEVRPSRRLSPWAAAARRVRRVLPFVTVSVVGVGACDTPERVVVTKEPAPHSSQKSAATPRKAEADAAPFRTSVVVTGPKGVELCTDVELSPPGAAGSKAGRALLDKYVLAATRNGSVLHESCSRAYRSRAVLATCALSTSTAVDAGSLKLQSTRHYYRATAAGPSTAEAKLCAKLGGIWEVAAADNPAAATERIRQSATQLFRGLERATAP